MFSIECYQPSLQIRRIGAAIQQRPIAISCAIQQRPIAISCAIQQRPIPRSIGATELSFLGTLLPLDPLVVRLDSLTDPARRSPAAPLLVFVVVVVIIIFVIIIVFVIIRRSGQALPSMCMCVLTCGNMKGKGKGGGWRWRWRYLTDGAVKVASRLH